jgi:hypothetical protein
MRKIWVIPLAGVLVLAWAGALRADDQAEAKAVVEKAIKATGGAEKLAKYKAMTWKEKGTYYGMGNAQPYTGVYAVQWPDKFKMEIMDVFTIVINGDQGWIKLNGEVKEMTREQMTEQKEERYAGSLAQLLPLQDKGYTLAAIGEDKVEGQPAVGIKVSHQGHRDVNLFFDKKSGLLVKSRYTVKPEELMGKEVSQEVVYGNYKEVEGLQQPMKITIKRDGKQFVEADNSDMKLSETLPDADFAKP